MFSGINQSGMFSNASFTNYLDRLSKTAQNANASTDQTAENKDSQEVSARDAFAAALKEKGMSDEKIANLPESFWKKAEKKAANKKDFNFGEDKQLQKLADFLAKKSDVVKNDNAVDTTTGDSSNISQEAKDAAAANAATEEAEESDVVTVETEEENAAGAKQYASIFDEFKDKLNQVLLEGVGLGGLSEANAGNAFMSYSASYEISYHSMVAVAGENGMTMQETSFSMKGSFEFMGMGSMSDLNEMAKNFNPFDLFSGKTDGAEDTDEVDKNDPFGQLQDYFSPEKTANRILDFSLGFFGNSSQFKEGGNTEDSRQGFADMIGAAIQKGFDQALGTLGRLPEKTEDEVDDTHTRVFDGLDNFVKTGSKDGNEAQPYAGFQSYSSVFEMNYSSTTAYYSAAETPDALEGLYNKYFNNGYGSAAQTQVADQSQEVTGEQQQNAQQQVSPINLTA